MDQQPGSWQNVPPVGGQSNGGSNVPPPPPPPIGIRTMESDLSSIKDSGGAASQPQPFTPQEFKPAPRPMIEEKPAGAKLNVPGYSGPEETIFNPQTVSTVGAPMLEAPAEGGTSKKWMKPALFGGGALVVLVGLGLVGYYVVYPLLFPAAALPAPVARPSQSAGTPATTTPATTGVMHKSLFVILPEKTETLTVQSADVALAVKTGLASLAKDTSMQTGTIKEVLFTDATGGIVSFSHLLALFTPELAESSAKAVFTDDFTGGIYFDQNGAWPVYAAQLASGVSPADAQTAFAAFEKSANLLNWYVADPGAPAKDGWKDGNINGKPTRYLRYAANGASMNYGWFGNYLVISTSYNGFKEAAKRLGL